MNPNRPEDMPSDFESLFRWAMYYDYRTTPERVAACLSDANCLHDTAVINFYSSMTECSPAQLSRSHFVLSITEFLAQYKQNIISEAKGKGLDARAVAAAIAWEFRQNLTGRLTDYLQIMSPGKKSGIGWGSMHTQEAIKLTGKTDIDDVACIRMDALSIIPLVAQFMKDCVDTYYTESNGIYIGKDPAVVSYFYNTGLKKVRESAKQRGKEIDALGVPPKTITLNVSVNPMAKWVKNNLDSFEQFKTSPKIPMSYRSIAVAN